MKSIKLHKYLYFLSVSCVITGLVINSHTILLYATGASIVTGLLKEYDSMTNHDHK